MALLDLLIVFVVVWLALSVVWVVRQRREPSLPDRWESRTRALPEGGHLVELVCRGEPTQPVRRLPGDLEADRLGDELAEAMSEAEARAAALNGARRR